MDHRQGDARNRIGAVARPVGTVAASGTRTLWTVQVMRGVAALMVVVGHSQSSVAGVVAAGGGAFARSTVVPWGAGVDLFFVISGFIIVHASARLFGRDGARRDFLMRRLVRIVPLYWLVTTLFLMLLGAAALKGGDRFPDAGAVLASYAFVPSDTYGDGRLFPVFDLGWTLNYEMLFYAVLALVVAWPRRTALIAVGAMLAALVALGRFVEPSSAAWFWTQPIILDFGLGVGVGALVARGVVLPGAVRVIVAAAALALLLADVAHVFDGPPGLTVANAWPRVMAAGLPIAAMLGAAVLGSEPRRPRAAAPLTQVGDASYSLYLLHPFALIAMEKLAQKFASVRDAPGWLLVAGTVALALAIALAAYRWIERPMTDALTRRLVKQPHVMPPILAMGK